MEKEEEKKRKVKLNWEEFAGSEEEETVVIEGKLQKTIEYIEVCPPDQYDEEVCICIYGLISVTDHLKKERIILFDRSEEDSELIQIGGDPSLAFVPLSDDRHISPPLDDDDGNLYLTMKLYIERDDAPGTIIVDVEDYKYQLFGDFCEDSNSFLVEGKSGYIFQVGYARFWGTRVKVDIAIHKNLNPNPNPPQGEGEAVSSGHKRKLPISNSLHGIVEACHRLPYSRTKLILFLKGEDEPTSVPIGSLVPLDRSIIVAPIRRPSILFIKFALFSNHSEAPFTDEVIPFPIKTLPHPSYPPTFITTKQPTHVKTILDGLITISFTFIDL